MNPNVGMPNMNPLGGPVGGAPMPMMNNGALNPQAAVVAAAAANRQQANENQRGVLNTYIYEYFIRYGMHDCARSLLSSDQPVNVLKDGGNRRRDENGNVINGAGDDPMETDSKDDIETKLPDDLPPPKLPMPTSDTSFLYEWFCLFWDLFNAQRPKGGGGNTNVNQYVAHTQAQSRMKQQELLRQMRPDLAQQQYQAQMMRNMQNGNMGMKQGALARAAMANNQHPQMMLQQAKNQMQRDPSGMDANRERPTSPTSGENAPSPSKRQRLDGAQFNPNQPGGVMPNGGRPVQGMPGQQMTNANAAAAQQLLVQNGSPMMPQGPDGTALNAFYNPGEIGGPGAMRPGPNGAQGGTGSNHALQDYQMQLMLLEQQNKKRLMMARQEQDMGGIPREGAPVPPGAPGAPPGPNGQQFPDTSPQGMRPGASPNPADQMKRGTPQMNTSGISSPAPENGQSRGSPTSAMNFNMANVDPSMQQHFFKGMDGTMAAQAQMNGMRPPGAHPGPPFNGQMTPQMMARHQQAQAAQQAGQQAQGNPQWQQGPNGQMPQGMQQNPQVQGTPQQRAMPPPSAPAAAGANANSKTTASPQQAAAAPPTPSQTNKPAPKKKETKSAKEKRAANKKSNQNLNNAAAAAAATPAAEASGDQEATPATPITPANPGNFNKNGNNTAPSTQAAAPNAASAAVSVPPGAQPGQPDPTQNNAMAMDSFSGMDFGLELANPLQSNDVLNDFDFDSFLHDGDNNEPFDFSQTFSGVENGEIGAE